MDFVEEEIYSHTDGACDERTECVLSPVTGDSEVSHL